MPETIGGLNLFAYFLNNPVVCLNSDITIVDGGIVASSADSSQSIRSVPEWLKIGVGALPDIISGIKYLRAKGIHNKFAYSTKTRFMYPITESTWRWFNKSNSYIKNYFNNFLASFKQILKGDARASWGAVAKSFGKTAAFTAFINLVFNYYENNCQVDGAMLLDTVIDTAIGLGAYGLATATTSLIVAGFAVAGFTIPGVVVIGGVILLSIGFDWLIREIIGYKA